MAGSVAASRGDGGGAGAGERRASPEPGRRG